MGCQSSRRVIFSAVAHVATALAVAAAVTVPAESFAQGLLKSLSDLGSAAASAVGGSANRTPSSARAIDAATSASAVAASRLPLVPSQAARAEIAVDNQCQEVVENFDIMQKASDYAGTAAQLRLQTLLSSDFKQNEFSDSDRDFLKYLAYTTVWIPSSIEKAVGKAWSEVAFQGGDQIEPSGRTERKALERQALRMEELRSGFESFPGSVELVVDREQGDGAFSRVGGIVSLSQRFVALMDDREGVRDVVLAHEMSHLYKRHALKSLQYRMVSSVQGWGVARRLIRKTIGDETKARGRAGPLDSIFGMIASGQATIESVGLAKDVVDLVNAHQTEYTTDQELEADACAIRLLGRFAIEPRAAWTAFAGVLVGADASTGYQAVHPSPQARTDSINLVLGGASGSKNAVGSAKTATLKMVTIAPKAPKKTP